MLTNKNTQRYYLLFAIVCLCFATNSLHSQTNLSSPYSRYGIGNTNLFNNAVNNAMGNIGLTYRSNNSVNYLNPASYTATDTTSLIFDMGFYTEWIHQKENSLSSSGNNTSLSHIMIAFPLSKKFAIAAGLLPFSEVSFSSSYDTVTSAGYYKTTYSGDGGLSQAILGLAYRPIENLSIGVNLEYIFGNYYKASTIDFPDSSYMYSTRIEKNYHITAFNFNLGLQYQLHLKNGDRLGLGLTYNPPIKFPSDNQEKRYNFYTSANIEYQVDSIFSDKQDNHISYPASYALGLSYERDNKFYVGLDGKYTAWKNFLMETDYVNLNLKNNFSLALGGQFRPDLYGSFLQKMVYRAGLSYDNGAIDLSNIRINQIGVSCGIGIPIKKTNTMMNFSFEYFKRGTTENNLILENYFRIGFSVTSKDLWFFKRKYQ